ncbi:MAG TPA: hypothetical protein VLA88_06635 [Candidatus Saccharimonadales bacterium]|nr:hypothetical protein [Candidatus Saccharimonadales bacterium]
MITNTLRLNRSHVLTGAVLFVAGLLTALLVALPTAAAAPVSNCKVDGKDGIKTGIGIDGTNCIPIAGGTLESNPIMIYLFAILRMASVLVGIATVGGFIWGGVLYITARANAGQVEKAKLVMINSTIGLLLFVFMYAILQFLIPGGVFNG